MPRLSFLSRAPSLLLALVVSSSLFAAAGRAAPPGALEQRVQALEATVDELKKEIAALKQRPVPVAPVAAGEPAEQQAAYPIPIGDSPVLGDRQAPIAFVVFTDFQCPFCARVFPLLQEVAADPELKGRVVVVVKDFPLPFHQNARPAARMALAVRELGGEQAFWAYAAKLYENQRALDDVSLRRWADEVGVGGARAARLVAQDGARFDAHIEADIALGTNAAHVRGTPTLFVGGWQLTTRSVEGVKALIRAKGL
jgi:protein-disulfide isomerase